MCRMLRRLIAVLVMWVRGNSPSMFSDEIVNWLCEKSCPQNKTVAELKVAYSNDAYLNEGIGKDDEIGLYFPTSHSFDAYVDGTVIAEDPSARGPQVPMIIGFSKCITVLIMLAE